MFEDISNLSSSDPKVGKAAALNIIQHVSQNKTELGYLVKRLVNGLESTKLQTRTGCYTTLSVLQHLQKIEPGDLFDLMQKALITNKQSSKKERRLIYIARILCTGSILKSSPAATLSKQEGLLKNVLHEIVDLCLKKSSYFQLATPYLSHLLSDNTLTQQVFDEVVWPEFSVLFENIHGKKKKKEGEEDEEDMVAVQFGCCVQLGLVCRNGGYKQDFEIGDVGKIVKALLVSKLQFEDLFLKSLFKSIKDSKPDINTFWTTLLENIKPTQFELLCLSVEKAVEEQIPLSCVISKQLIRLLLGVFNSKDTEFHGKSQATIRLLLKWNDKDGNSLMGKKERKVAISCLFGGEAPNLLHEYKRLSSAVRDFIFKLKTKDLEYLRGILIGNLEDKDTLGVRMAITYLNVLGKIAVCRSVGDECLFEIGKKLLLVAIGKEVIEIEKKGEGELGEVQEQLRSSACENFKAIMASSYNVEFIRLLWEYVVGEIKNLSDNETTLKVFKDAKKLMKRIEDVHFRSLLIGYCVRVLIDEREVLSLTVDGANELIEIGKGLEGDVAVEVVKFICGRVVKELLPCVFVEGVFGRLMIEGKVGEGVVQELASSIDVDVGEGEVEEDSDEDSGSEDDEPLGKVPKIDPEKLAELQQKFGASDSEESINLEDADEQDLKKMDGALAKVFAIKKQTKNEGDSNLRGMMRCLRLIEMFVQRNIKCMGVGELLILLNPVVNCLKWALQSKKHGDVTTRVIGVLDNLCRVKKFSGVDEVQDGVIGEVVKEVYEVGKVKRFRLVREVIELCVVCLVKCFLGGKRGKKDCKGVLSVFFDAADIAREKLKRRKKRKGVKVRGLETSRFVRLGLEVIGGSWGEGRSKIEERIKEGKGSKGE